jgi:hypothetical protein
VEFRPDNINCSLLETLPWVQGKPELLFNHLVRVQLEIDSECVVDKFLYFGKSIDEPDIRNKIFRYLKYRNEDFEEKALTILSQQQHLQYNDLLRFKENRHADDTCPVGLPPPMKSRSLTPAHLKPMKHKVLKLGGGFNTRATPSPFGK